MNQLNDELIVDSVVDELDRQVEAVDASDDQFLNHARRKALASGLPSSRKLISGWAFAGVAAVVMAVVVMMADRNEGETANITETLVADTELYEEMEFYQWLSEELE